MKFFDKDLFRSCQKIVTHRLLQKPQLKLRPAICAAGLRIGGNTIMAGAKAPKQLFAAPEMSVNLYENSFIKEF